MLNQELNTILDFYQIVKDYNELIRVDYPILFSGKNKYNGMLIGTVVYDDYDNDQYTLIQVPVEVDDYYSFLNKKITLRKIYEKQEKLLMIVNSYEGKNVINNLLPFDEIPKDFLPLDDSFCPDIIVPKSTRFGFALKGKLADEHKAFVHDINEVQERLFQFLNKSLEVCSRFHYKPKIYLQPSQVSSFKINFDIEFEHEHLQQLPLFGVSKDKIIDFYSDYIDYVIRDLPQGKDNLLIGTPEQALTFQKIKEKLKDVYKDAHVSDDNIEDKLIESIAETALKVSQVTDLFKSSESFNSAAVNKVYDDKEFEYGYLTEKYFDEVNAKILLPEDVTTNLISIEKEIDTVEKPYRIRVTHFGETGVGRAELYLDDTENFIKIRIRINKTEDQSFIHSIYTKSLNDGIPVDIKGIATRINGSYSTIVSKL